MRFGNSWRRMHGSLLGISTASYLRWEPQHRPSHAARATCAKVLLEDLYIRQRKQERALRSRKDACNTGSCR